MYDTLNNTTIHASTFTFSYHVTKSIKSLLGVTEIKATPPPPLLIQLPYFMNLFLLLAYSHFWSVAIKAFFFPYAGKTYLPVYTGNCMFSLFFFLIVLVFDPQLPTCTVYIGLLILS